MSRSKREIGLFRAAVDNKFIDVESIINEYDNGTHINVDNRDKVIIIVYNIDFC